MKLFFYYSDNTDENDSLGLSQQSSIDESTLPKLNVEFVKSNEPMLSGRRIVDVKHFMKQILELGKHSTKCTMGRYVLFKEIKMD